MGRIAALAAVLALGCAMASAAALAAAAEARGTPAACVKRKPVKRGRTAAATRGPPRARLRPGKLASKAGRRTCHRRRDASTPAPPGADRRATLDERPTSPPAGEPVALAPASPQAPSEPETSPLPAASTIGVEAYDFGTFVLRLTRLSVPAGNLTIYFRNHDVSAHNLWLDRPDLVAAAERISDDVGKGGGAVTTVRVTAGAWRLYCSLPGHGSMDRTLIVT
jgi:plastocyanin